MSIDPVELREAFGNFTCDKMSRAWRNRSPVTQSKWRQMSWRAFGDFNHAAALYVACGEMFPDLFDADMSILHWERIAQRIPELIADPPDKALSIGEYEKQKAI